MTCNMLTFIFVCFSRREDTLSPHVQPEGRRAASRVSEVKSLQTTQQTPSTGLANRIPATVSLHQEVENEDSDTHPLTGTHGNNTLTCKLTSTAKRKSNSTTSLNNLSLIL